MLKLATILTEVLSEIADSPYHLEPPKESEGSDPSVDYKFKTDTGREYYVRFSNRWIGPYPDRNYQWNTELTFFPTDLRSTQDSSDIGGENFGKILATVALALKNFLKDYKPEHVYWSGIKGDNERSDQASKRQRIYNTALSRAASSMQDYEVEIGDKKSSITYKGPMPIQGASEIFKYREKSKGHKLNLARS